MCLSVCVSVHLFTINLKNIFVNLGSGLEFKKLQVAHQNVYEFFQKLKGTQ